MGVNEMRACVSECVHASIHYYVSVCACSRLPLVDQKFCVIISIVAVQ